jgi:Fur family ferric uptake transcriptional regulator
MQRFGFLHAQDCRRSGTDPKFGGAPHCSVAREWLLLGENEGRAQESGGSPCWRSRYEMLSGIKSSVIHIMDVTWRTRALSKKPTLNDDIVEICRANGLRVTGPRRIIVQLLSEATDHPDVTELHRRVMAIDPTIALATVYRTVKLLEDMEIIERHTFGDGRSRYESAGHAHHDHLIDVDTGAVIEFRSDEIERLQEEIARKHGYEIVSHKLEIFVRPLDKSHKSKSRKRS